LPDRSVPATGKPDGKKNQPFRTNSSGLSVTKNRKYSLRLLNIPTRAYAFLFVKGGTVKLKPAKPKPANRKGKKIYTDEVITSLRLIRAFFRYKCGKLPAPLMRRYRTSVRRHCGQATSGQYILTLTATDAASGWIYLCSLLNKAHRRTFATLRDIHASFSFPLMEFHSDNGSGLINHVITDGTATLHTPSPLPVHLPPVSIENAFGNIFLNTTPTQTNMKMHSNVTTK
jgi:hypothetical protein